MSFNIFIVKVLVSSINIILLPLTTVRFLHSFRLHCKSKKLRFSFIRLMLLSHLPSRGELPIPPNSFFKNLSHNRKEGGTKRCIKIITDIIFWKLIPPRGLYETIISSVSLNRKRSKRNTLEMSKTFTAKYNLQRNCLWQLKNRPSTTLR